MKKIILIIAGVLVLAASVWLAVRSRMKYNEEMEYLSGYDYSSTRNESDNVTSEETIKTIPWNKIKWDGPDDSDENLQTIFTRFVENQPYSFQYGPSAISEVIWLQDSERPAAMFRHRDSLNFSPNEKDILYINNILCYISRNNDLLLKAYNRFRPIVFKIVSDEMYNELNLKQYLSLLDEAYAEFSNDGELNINLLSRLHEELTMQQDEYYSLLEKVHMALDNYDIYFPETEIDDYEAEERVGWAYSFWARRYAEGNIKAVRTILDDIWEHFENNSETLVAENAFTNEEIPVGRNNIRQYKRYFDNGNLSATYQYDSKNKRTGNWISYFEDETVSCEFEMKDGMLNGVFKDYCHGESVIRLCTFKDNQMLTQENYKCNGDLVSKKQYSNGKLNGDFYEIKNDLMTTTHYRDGKLHGNLVIEYANGNVKEEAKYENGVLNGEEKTYFSDGTLASNTLYVQGSIKKSKVYNEKGILIADWNVPEGGYYKRYYPSGAIKEETPYVNGQIHGKVIEYDESGKVIKRTKYENGVKID